MADLDRSPGILPQIKLVTSLRWRVLRNSIRRKNNRLDLIGLIISAVFASLFALGLCGAFYAGAFAFISRGRPTWLALLFGAILIFWQLFPVFVAGFGSSFEFRNMLRFPLRLEAFYLIGLAYGGKYLDAAPLLFIRLRKNSSPCVIVN